MTNPPMVPTSSEFYSPLGEHLEDLRRMLIRVFCIIGIGFIGAISFYSHLFSFLTIPLNTEEPERLQLINERILNSGTNPILYHLPQGVTVKNTSKDGVIEIHSGLYSLSPQSYLDIEKVESNHRLAIFGPTDGFSTILKICFWTACVATSPFWLLFVVQFISPGLTTNEKHLAIPFLCFSVFFLTLGGCFAYYVTIPFANYTLWNFNALLGQNLWSLSNYVNFTLFLLFSHALAFEIALVFFMLVHLGVLSRKWMMAKRKFIIIGAFVIGALLTPPDILSQMLMAALLIALYELAILYAWLREEKEGHLTRI